MSRRIEKKNSQAVQGRRVSTTVPVPERSGEDVYNDLFPLLSSSSTATIAPTDAAAPTPNRLASTSHRSDQEVQDSAQTTTERKPSPWKTLPEQKQNLVLTHFMTDSQKAKLPTTPSTPIIVRSQQEVRPKSKQEKNVNDKLCEIILSIHLRKEFVSVERVERELFGFYGVESFSQLQVNQRNLDALINLIHYNRDVIFYMQVFEQIFNLCTLHDLGPLLAKFLQVERYEDARLGPLDVHPAIKNIFKYKPTRRHQPIPAITCEDIINAFLKFQESYRGRRFYYEEFLNDLVQRNQLQNREELGIYCKSFPYLTEVTRKLDRDYTQYKKKADSNVRQQMISLFQNKLWEIKQEMNSELEQSAYSTKSTIAIFDHLTSTVEKHLTVPEQKTVRDILLRIRNDDLLRCLFNISIYMGDIDDPEKFLAELQRIYQRQTGSERKDVALPLNSTRRHNKHSGSSANEQKSMDSGAMSRTIIDTSFENSLVSSDPNRPKISVKELCSELAKCLERYETVLTIKQLHDIEKHICRQHSVRKFSDFGIIDDDQMPLDLISFLYTYRDKIDPNGTLSLYEGPSSTSNRQEMYRFVNQLTVFKDQRGEEQSDRHQRAIHMSKDESSAVEKVIKHKFGGLLGFNCCSQILHKAKQQQRYEQTPTRIYYEESLLDVVAANRLGLCPPSLLVDDTQLCLIILRCPIMMNLCTWLQWPHFFQPRHGALKTFLVRNEHELNQLLLLEISDGELLRLPNDFSRQAFEIELEQKNIRSAVGHLSALIACEYVQVNQLPLSIYRQVMTTWFIRLRSSAQLQANSIDPMNYVLEFLTHLPALLGQTRIVQELVLEPLDDVFGNENENEPANPRKTIWNLANVQQKSKLEMWAHTLGIDEWKNENKWKGTDESKDESAKKSTGPQTVTCDIIIKPVQAEVLPTVAPPLYKTNSVATESPPVDRSVLDENDPTRVAFEHIKKIREGFGVDSSLDAAGQSIVTNLQGMVERSLEKLSNDLFSEQAHFVLELIQNADDNQYTADLLPTLRFMLSSERILVCNNEMGFRPNDISAICNVGRSTKGKHKQGYVGHKGIGFKSVFMVSHRPEIHSGHYHFCFDTLEGTDQIGYIRPIWLEDYAEDLTSTYQWKTCIRLPIKAEKRGDRLKRNFDDIQARLLLFLNRLRQVEIVRQQSKNETISRIFTRIDHAQGQIIELQERSSTSEKIIKNFWLVVKKVIQVPADLKTKLSDTKCDVESTTIAVAYPLNPIHESFSHQVLPTQPLFAFLPLRSYGFRFILQGDFEIPATRQEVLRDNMWNEWLKTEMIQLLPLAYEQFQRLPDLLASCSLDFQGPDLRLTPMQTLKYFLKLIPTRNELDSYFNTFIDKIVQLLMGIIQLPITQNQRIEWVSPTRCVIVRDAFIRQIFPEDLLLSHFNSYYLDEQIVNECDETILIKLGCYRLDFSAILRLIRTLYTQNEQQHSTSTTSIEQIAQWFLCIDYSLQQERDKPGFNLDDDDGSQVTSMTELRKMKIIPLRDQSRLVSIEEFDQRAILFPLDKKASYAKYLRIVLEDTPIIDERLLDFIENKYPRRFESVKRLLKDLGITEALNVRRIYSNHILPMLMDDAQWSKKSDAVLIASLILIYKDLYAPRPDHFMNDMEKLKNQLIIKTRQGIFVRINSNASTIIHLTSLYGCEHSLDVLPLLKDHFTFIADDYYTEYRKELFYRENDRILFIHFLNDLDISDFFHVKVIEHPYANVEQLAGTLWTHEIPALSPILFEPFFIRDYRCDEFDTLVSANHDTDLTRCIQILLYLDRSFSSLSLYYVASVIPARARHAPLINPVKGVESSFYFSLRKHAWIPVGSQLFKSTDVYFLQNHPFRRYVPHLDLSKVPLKNADFINLLGFKSDISPMTMFELLMKWSCHLECDVLRELLAKADEQAWETIPYMESTTPKPSCRDTIENFRRIYIFLAADPGICMLLARFRLWPLIFIPRNSDTGEFLSSQQAFWSDPEMLLTTNRDRNQSVSLQLYYDNDKHLQQLFIEVLQVKRAPTLEDYLPLLSKVTDQSEEFIWKSIEAITRLAFLENKLTTVKDQCINWAFIPCLGTGTRLMKYTDQLYYPHDMNVANLFAEVISIVKLPDVLMRSSEFKHQFCTLFNINDFANMITVQVNVDNEQLSSELRNFYAHSVDLIQNYLLAHTMISETRSSYLQSVFSRVRFFSVDRIRLSYRYQESIVRTLPPSTILDSYIDDSMGKFYILKKYEQSESRHIDAMVNYLVSDQAARLALAHYIRQLFRTYQDEGIVSLEKLREHLPAPTATIWIIPDTTKVEASEPLDEDEDTENNESIDIPREMLEAMKNQPGWKLLKPRSQVPSDPNQSMSIIRFPETAGVDITVEPTLRDPLIKSQLPISDGTKSTETIPKKDPIAMDKSLPVSKMSDVHEQSTGSASKRGTGQRTEVSEKTKSTVDLLPSERSHKSSNTSFSLADFTPPRASFEHIPFSTLKNFSLSSTPSSNIPSSTTMSSSGNETDRLIGRRGEDFVYRYLNWKYPEKKIEWVNEKQESGQPFDIRMVTKASNSCPVEFIEVKTTRSLNQNTFQISINEIECLLANPTNYHIYRVYSVDDEKSCRVTVISGPKVRLQQKQLALSMTILEESDE